MKKIILLFCLALCFSTQAQKIKFKDILLLINSGQKENAYTQLKVLLRSDTALPSANLQIAHLLFEKSKNFDVLKSNDAAMIFCDSTSFYLKRAKRQINKKEIRKNEDYYLAYKNIPTNTENSDTILKRIMKDISFKENDITTYRNKTKNIFTHFNKSLVNYTKASQNYYKINSNYTTAKEMCLLSDEKLNTDLHTIIVYFDSSIYHLKAYLKAIKEFPINGYNQTFDVAPIETYRIDGLTNSNFFDAKITMWNYGAWATTYKSIIENEIKKIRTQIIFYDNRYNVYMEKIKNFEVSYDSVATIRSDNKLYKLIKKFDYNSLAIKILNYKQCKLDYLGNKLQKIYSLDNTHAGNIEAKAGFAHSMSKQILRCDTSLHKISTTNLTTNSIKYATYITKTFGDTVGLKTYLENEKVFLQNQRNENNLFYQTMMYGQVQKYFDTTLYMPHGNYQIPMFHKISPKNNIQTTAVNEDSKQNIFATGNLPTGEVFLCKINSSKKVEWLKTLPKKVANSTEFSSALTITDDECIMIINSSSDGIVKNTLVKFDKNGTEKFSKPLNANTVARHMIYDEINDAYLIVFKGISAADYSNKLEEVAIANFDGMGNYKKYLSLKLNGSVAELSKISDGYMLIFNYVSLQINGTKLESEAGNTIENPNICMIKLNPQAEIKLIETITSKTPIYSVGSVKISNNVINILGYDSPFTANYYQQLPFSYTKRLHKVINSDLEFVE